MNLAYRVKSFKASFDKLSRSIEQAKRDYVASNEISCDCGSDERKCRSCYLWERAERAMDEALALAERLESDLVMADASAAHWQAQAEENLRGNNLQ